MDGICRNILITVKYNILKVEYLKRTRHLKHIINIITVIFIKRFIVLIINLIHKRNINSYITYYTIVYVYEDKFM